MCLINYCLINYYFIINLIPRHGRIKFYFLQLTQLLVASLKTYKQMKSIIKIQRVPNENFSEPVSNILINLLIINNQLKK